MNVFIIFQASIMNPGDDDDLDDSDLGQEDSGDHSLVKNKMINLNEYFKQL